MVYSRESSRWCTESSRWCTESSRWFRERFLDSVKRVLEGAERVLDSVEISRWQTDRERGRVKKPEEENFRWLLNS